MSVQLSVALRNARAAAFEATIGASAVLKLRSGSPPADLAAARSGVVLATLPLPADWLSAPAAGVVSKAGTWQDPSADVGGVAGHFEICAADGVTPHMQGLVAQPYAASTAVVVGQQMFIGSAVYRATTAGITGAAIPPAGTGAGIADGAAVWAYAGLLAMSLVNTQIAVGQVVDVATFTLTEAGA